MSETQRVREFVRRDLALGERLRPRRRCRLLRVTAVAALLWSLAGAPSPAQPPYQQEVVPGLSSLTLGAYAVPDFADLNGDGDPDLLGGGQPGALRTFENVGSISSARFVGLPSRGKPFDDPGDDVFRSFPELADLDGDGDLDALIGRAYGGLVYFENTGSPLAPAFAERTGSANPFESINDLHPAPTLADLDADGDLDLAFSVLSGSIEYYENTGNGTTPVFAQRSGAASPFDGILLLSPRSTSFSDLDGDGDLDGLTGDFQELVYLENTGSSTAPAFVEGFGGFGLSFDFHPAADFVDLDGDADFDVVVGRRGGGLQYLENTGSSTAPAFVERNAGESPFEGADAAFLDTSPDLVDLDGDGDLDAVVGRRVPGFHYYENVGSLGAPAFVERTGSESPTDGIDAGHSATPEVIDLDGDGDLDLVIGNDQGTLTYFEDTGDETTPAFVQRTGTANPLSGVEVQSRSEPSLADLDGDGDLDAVVGDFGALAFWENTGTPTAPAYVEGTGVSNPFDGLHRRFWNAPNLVDFDGDGDVDLVIGGDDGTLVYRENVGTPTRPVFSQGPIETNPFRGLDTGSTSSPDLADLDGDGDLDVVAGERYGKIVFYRSLSSRLFRDGFESGDTSAWSATVP